MRIGISALGSNKLSQTVEAAKNALKELGHDVATISDSSFGLGVFDFLVFIAEPKGIFGGIASSLPQILAGIGGLQGKRCLAMMRKRGFRSESTLRKFMDALEHEGLLVVEGEIFGDAQTAAEIVANAPLKRG